MASLIDACRWVISQRSAPWKSMWVVPEFLNRFGKTGFARLARSSTSQRGRSKEFVGLLYVGSPEPET
jgi:hypothetical protein